MTFRYILLALGLALGSLALTAQTPETEAPASSWVALYERDDYEGAAKALEQEIATQGATPERYYNLGVCYERLKQGARSLLSYERALWLDPTMSQARHNLRLGYAQSPSGLSDGRAIGFVDDICYALSRPALMVVGLVLTLLMVVGLIIFRLGATVLRRQVAFYTAVGLACLWLLVGAMIAHQWHYRKVSAQRALVIEGTSLLSSPSSAEPLMALPAGSPLRLESLGDGWAHVSLYDGRSGYVPSHTIEAVVRPPL